MVKIYILETEKDEKRSFFEVLRKKTA